MFITEGERKVFEHLPPTIVYTRHPQCLHNVDNDDALRRGIPNRKSPLTQAGELQREMTAEYLQTTFGIFDIVICSEFLRTHTIPQAAGYGDQMQIHPGLNERDMGVWHQMPREEVRKKYPDESARLTEMGYFYYDAPGGETCFGVEDRLRTLLFNRSLFEGMNVAYFSAHGISGFCTRRLLTGASIADWHIWRGVDSLKNASVTVFERKPGGAFYTCSLYNHIPWEGKIDPELLKKRVRKHDLTFE